MSAPVVQQETFSPFFSHKLHRTTINLILDDALLLYIALAFFLLCNFYLASLLMSSLKTTRKFGITDSIQISMGYAASQRIKLKYIRIYYLRCLDVYRLYCFPGCEVLAN